MIVRKYLAVYVEVPTGYLGVDYIYAGDKNDLKFMKVEHLKENGESVPVIIIDAIKAKDD